MCSPGARLVASFRQELGRPAERDARRELAEQVNGGARHPAVINVAHDSHLQALQRFFVAQDGVGIEQRLRGMLVHSVARVDHRDVQVFCHQRRCASLRMANDDDVRPHRAQRVAGVEQGLAFLDARSAGEDQRGHRAQRFGRDFKRTAGARGGFVEQKQHPLAAQQRAGLQGIHAPGQLEQAQNFLRSEMFDAQQGAARSFDHGLHGLTRERLAHE